MSLVAYKIDMVTARTTEVDFVDGEMIKREYEGSWSGNIVDKYDERVFTKEMGDIDELYESVKRIFTYRLEPKMSTDGSTIVLERLVTDKNINPTRSEFFDWQDGKARLRVIEYRLRVLKITRSVDFSLDSILDDEAPDTLMGFKVREY